MQIQGFNSSGFGFIFAADSKQQFIDSIFSSISSATPISVDNVDADLSFLRVFFDRIYGTNEGGAIHAIAPSNSLLVNLSKVVATYVQTADGEKGSFGYIETAVDNEVSDSTFAFCATKKTAGHHFFRISCKKAYYHGGNVTHGVSNSDHLNIESRESTVKWVHFENCTVNQHGIIVFMTGTHVLSLSMFLDDEMISPLTDAGAIFSYTNSKLTVNNIYMKNMKGGNAVAAQGGTCFISDSVIDVWQVYQVQSERIKSDGTRPPTIMVYPVKLNKKLHSCGFLHKAIYVPSFLFTSTIN